MKPQVVWALAGRLPAQVAAFFCAVLGSLIRATALVLVIQASTSPCQDVRVNEAGISLPCGMKGELETNSQQKVV